MRKSWTYSEEKIILDNYEICTIKEMEELLPGRNNESINAKIKRLKKNGKMKGNKNKDVIARAYKQRNITK